MIHWLDPTRKRSNNGLRAVAWLAIPFGIYCVGEIATRALGFLDFPTYEVSDDVGYMPKPLQSGEFLRRNDWIFNDRSMGIASLWVNRTNRPNLLLIGNSIIMGGNAYRQSEKVAPLLQRQLGDGIAVWPLAVGGWTTVNETAFLEKNPDIVSAANGYIWFLGKGGFKELARWHSDLAFPTKTPNFALPYVIERYLLPTLGLHPVNELPPQGAPLAANVERFRQMVERLGKSANGNGVFLLYPDKPDMSLRARDEEWLSDRNIIEGIAAERGVRIVDLSRVLEWQNDLYRDGVHPSTEGNTRISEILAKVVKEDMFH